MECTPPSHSETQDAYGSRSCSGVGLQWPGARALGGGGGESSAVGVALRDCSGEPSLSEPLEFMSEPYELAERMPDSVFRFSRKCCTRPMLRVHGRRRRAARAASS